MIKTFYHPGFAAPIGNHQMPIGKFAAVAEFLRSQSYVQLVRPLPVNENDILRVHSLEYLRAIQMGEPRILAESQKFPWSPELYSSVLLTNGGVLASAQEALATGYSAALASGFHHSHHKRGEGFCTFNGLVIALEAMRAAGQIQTAAILDMDLHYGNGTAQLVVDRPWIQVLSIYGNDYWDNTAYRDVSTKRHQDGTNHRSAALPDGCDRPQLLKIMEESLPQLLEQRPDLLIYQAGADPYFEDPYSPLQLNHEDLLERDRRVFQFSKENHIPISWVLAGGYTSDISKIVRVHTNTFQAWKELYGGE